MWARLKPPILLNVNILFWKNWSSQIFFFLVDFEFWLTLFHFFVYLLYLDWYYNCKMTNTDESLSMYFDDDFNPSSYIDKLVNSITNLNPASSTTPVSAYSKQSLTKLSNDISHLITHLDYYTNMLTNDSLQKKLDA